MEKIQNFLCVAAKKIFLCLHIFIVVMILLEFGRLAGDVFPLHYQLLNALLALIGLIAISLLFFICCTRKIASCVCKKNRVVMFCIFYAVIIFVMQMYLCKCIYFYTTWDVGILQSAADVVTHGGTIQDWISQRGDSFSQNYFNAYPNNIFLTIIFAGIKYLSSLFGCVDNYFPTIVAGVISTDAAIVFTVMTVWKLTHSRKVTFLSIIICTVFLGFNPWIIIPYSDTYVLPFLSAVLYFYYAQDNKMIYNILQSIWVSIQILVCFFAIFFDNRNKRALFIAMTLTGINLFLMIFEVRARYLFMFVPLYITAAMLGLFYMQAKVKMIKDRKCHLQ